MSSTAANTQETKRNYITLLRFCGDAPVSDSPAQEQDFNAVKQALNNLTDVPPPVRSLLPLLYHNAKAHGLFDELKDDAKQLIKTSAMVLIAREAATQRWLTDAINEFERNNIPTILLKGAAFSGYLYSEEAPRPGVDVDLLIKQKDWDKACNILGETMSPLVLAENRLATHQALFERVFAPQHTGNPTVELHRGLTNPYIFTIDEEALWRDSEPHCKYHNENVRVLSPSHTLLHLAVHSFRDLEFCSHSLLDVNQLFKLRLIDEEHLYEEAHKWGAKHVLYHLLSHSQELLGASVSSRLLARLEPTRLSKAAQKIALTNNDNNQSEGTAHRLRQLWSQLVFPDSLWAALQFQAHYTSTRIKDFFHH